MDTTNPLIRKTLNTRATLKLIRKNAQRVYEQQRTEKYVKDESGKPVSADYLRRKIVNEALAVLGLWGDYHHLEKALTTRPKDGKGLPAARGRHFRRLGKAALKKGLYAPVWEIAKCGKGYFPYSDADYRKIKFVNNKGIEHGVVPTIRRPTVRSSVTVRY